VLRPSDERYGKVVDYLRWCCRESGLEVELVTDGDRMRIASG
jgi:hypothetical protein